MGLSLSAQKIAKRIKVALGKEDADLLITGARLVNVFTRTVEDVNISIVDGVIAAVYKSDIKPPAKAVRDIGGKYIIPGLIDAHTHVEMSYVSGVSFAEGVLPNGTTATMLDPHDVSNVMGNKGVSLLEKELKGTPLKFFLMSPPCVPSSPILEDAGFEVTPQSMEQSFNIPSINGIAETMDFGRVLSCEPDMMEIIALGRDKALLFDGHAPEVAGEQAMAYFGTGPIRSCHESVSVEEMYEKYSMGVHVIIRRGSLGEPASAGEFISMLNDTSRVLLSTDGCINIPDMLNRGHMNYALKQVVEEGVDPLVAVQMATINVARAYRLDNKIGAVAPGYDADMVVVEDLKDFKVVDVYLNGEVVDKNLSLPRFEYPKEMLNTIKLKKVKAEDLVVKGDKDIVNVNVIEMIDKTAATALVKDSLNTKNGNVTLDIEKDILKCTVMERYGRGKGYSVGFTKGFGFKRGAIAGSIGQDTQNMVAVGASDDDMATAINAVIEMQGGIALVEDRRLIIGIPMPIFGIMSQKSFKELESEFNLLQQRYEELGGTLSDVAFTLSLQLALAVIPEAGFTNRGLVDVAKSKFIDVII